MFKERIDMAHLCVGDEQHVERRIIEKYLVIDETERVHEALGKAIRAAKGDDDD